MTDTAILRVAAALKGLRPDQIDRIEGLVPLSTRRRKMLESESACDTAVEILSLGPSQHESLIQELRNAEVLIYFAIVELDFETLGSRCIPDGPDRARPYALPIH